MASLNNLIVSAQDTVLFRTLYVALDLNLVMGPMAMLIDMTWPIMLAKTLAVTLPDCALSLSNLLSGIKISESHGYAH